MAYNLGDLVSAHLSAATNAVGLATNVGSLGIVRGAIRTEIERKFLSGDPATIASAGMRGVRSLPEQARFQAKVEGTLLEFAVGAAPLKESIRRAALATGASPGFVRAVMDRLEQGGAIQSTRGTIRLANREIPDLMPDVALRLGAAVRQGICRLSELSSDVLLLRTQLRDHPLVNIVDFEGTAYALFENTSERSQWIPKGLVEFVLSLARQPATDTALLAMFTGEPMFPKEYLNAPDFVPDHIYSSAGTLHQSATRWQMLVRKLDYRVSLLGERVIATRFGSPFSTASCLDYDGFQIGSSPKKAEDVWQENRQVLLQGVAHEILGRNRDPDTDLASQIDALVDIAQGPDRYNAEKIRERFGGRKLSDAALQRVMMLAGRNGLMGTSLGSHYRLYERGRAG